MTWRDAMIRAERRYWRGMLKQHRGRIKEVAAAAGVTRDTAYRRLRVLGLESNPGTSRPFASWLHSRQVEMRQ